MDSGGPLSALKNAVRAGSNEFMPPPVLVESPLPEGMAQDELRTAHATLCKNGKAYFPLSFRDGVQATVRFVIDHGTLEMLESSDDVTGASEGARSFFARLVPTAKAAMGATYQGHDDSGTTVTPLDQLDDTYHAINDVRALSSLIDTVPGIDDAHVSAVVRERMRMARSMLCSFATLSAKGRIDAYAVGFLYGSFEIGTRYGMPVLPKRPDAWQEALGLPERFAEVADRSYRYYLLDAYLSLLFPGMGLEVQEELFSDFETYVSAIEEKTFGDTVSETVLEHLDMTPKEVNERVAKLESLYG